MIVPPFLGPGDGILLISCSRWTTEEMVSDAEALLAERGYRALRSEHLFSRDGQFGGTDEERASDLTHAWTDPTVKAIWAMRGGYGAQRILPLLDEVRVSINPKWLIGFSDVTALHGWLNSSGVCSIHGPVQSTISSTDSADVETLFKGLKGEWDEVHFSGDGNRVGQCAGRLVGGNLSVLQTMIGTDSIALPEDAVLFLEDIDEMIYHVDRMMLHMDRAGIFQKLNGMILGSFSDMRDNTIAHGFSSDNPYGKDVHAVLSERLQQLGIPVAFGFPGGHGERNVPLLLGANVTLEVRPDESVLRYT